MHKKAFLVKKLYKLDKPDEYRYQALYKLEPLLDDIEYVVISAVKNDSELYTGMGIILHETYLFKADMSGEIKDYSELDGSQRMTISHDEVLANIGYEIVTGKPKTRLELIND